MKEEFNVSDEDFLIEVQAALEFTQRYFQIQSQLLARKLNKSKLELDLSLKTTLEILNQLGEIELVPA